MGWSFGFIASIARSLAIMLQVTHQAPGRSLSLTVLADDCDGGGSDGGLFAAGWDFAVEHDAAGASSLWSRVQLDRHSVLGGRFANFCGAGETYVHDGVNIDFTDATLSLDFRNAYNSIHRSTVSAALAASPAGRPFLGYFLAGHGSDVPPPLFLSGVVGPVCYSEQGACQGDPLGGVYFCFGLQPLLLAAHGHVRRTRPHRVTRA